MAIKKSKIKEVENKAQNVVPTVFDSKKVFVIKQPWITEKSHNLSTEGRYVFVVDNRTNKAEIKKAVKVLYKVDPVSVNIINARGKSKHFKSKITAGSKYKKAIVMLKKGQKIDVMPT